MVGEETLVELRGEVQRHPDALEILAGLAVQADVDEKRHPPPSFGGGADEAQNEQPRRSGRGWKGYVGPSGHTNAEGGVIRD
jgi:hypothetical protein